MKVFVLTGKWQAYYDSGGYDSILGAFSSRELAEAAQVKHGRSEMMNHPDDYEIEEFELNQVK